MIRIWLLMKHLPKIFKNESNYKKSLNIQHSKQKLISAIRSLGSQIWYIFGDALQGNVIDKANWKMVPSVGTYNSQLVLAKNCI